MNNLTLNNYGVSTLEVREMEKIDGGGWLADAIAGVIEYYKCSCRETEMHWSDSPFF